MISADGAMPPLLPSDDPGAVVTVGTFDGVHRGHHAVLEEINRRAARTGRRSVLVTFHPHPLRIVRPEFAPRLLTIPSEKKEFLAESGVQYAIFLEFTSALQQYSPRRFVTEILLGRLGMKELVMGYDHGFGKDREGTVDTMRELGEEFGFAVDVVGEVRVGGDAISSSKIRQALERGDVVAAAEALGRPYSLQGRVIEGMKRGRELGFPTANIQLEDAEKMLPKEGIYAVHGLIGAERIPGLLHLGPRPTFPGYPPSVELYLLDWSGDLYGRSVRVDFCAFMREIEPYKSADKLVEQLHRDVEHGRAVFADPASTACGKLGS